MSADPQAPDQRAHAHPGTLPHAAASTPGPDDEEEEEEDDDDDDDDDEEPKLKYAKLTTQVASIYSNGDSTSALLVAGDKMVVGTHNGSINVLSIPTLQSLRSYRAHQASVTSVSISPVPPPPALVKGESRTSVLAPPPLKSAFKPSTTASPRPAGKAPSSPVPNLPSNQIYIATSSLDGHVCVSSLVDPADVLLRNFARPVSAVSLSPDYRNDRTYLSGGLAGSLILTVGGKAGTSQDANTNSAAAAASGWLGSIGLGANTGKDTVLHSGEGAISSIKWSLSGKWVVWVTEKGIKICRSHLQLGSEDGDDAWKRIAHAERPNRTVWEEMAGVWRARCEWIDESILEHDGPVGSEEPATLANGNGAAAPTTAAKSKRTQKLEKLVVGWGDTAWVIYVQESNATTAGKRQVGIADIAHKLQFRDCIISGISLYTPSLLAILAYRTRDDDDRPIAQHNQPDTPSKKGRQHRHTSLAPQVRLINVVGGEEVTLDELGRMSRFETLAAQDYHLGTLHIPPPIPENASKEQQKGALEGLWDAAGGGYATRIFSSSASVRSGGSGGREGTSQPLSLSSPRATGPGSAQGVEASPDLWRRRQIDAHPYILQPGLKLFVHSPYDCVLAVKRDLSDHLSWLLEHQQYDAAWKLVDRYPDAAERTPATQTDDSSTASSQPGSPMRREAAQGSSLADFFADPSPTPSVQSGSLNADAPRQQTQPINSSSQREKRRIGELWLHQLVTTARWTEAGRVAGLVLDASPRWEHWIWRFAQAHKFDEITPYVPFTTGKPSLPSVVYEVILGHYVGSDARRLSELLDVWDPESGLYDVRTVIGAVEDRLASLEDSGEEEADDSWRMLVDALARLYMADGRASESLKCYVRLQDAEKVFGLLREEKMLATAAAEDIPAVLVLRLSKDQLRSAPLDELREASAEAVQMLVDEAFRGTVPPSMVIKQLARKGNGFEPFLFFYLQALWNGAQSASTASLARAAKVSNAEGHALVEDHADLAVRLFAEYDRPLLSKFLETSVVYSYERAAEICKARGFIDELVLILSKTGESKAALSLIISKLGDVSRAIKFARERPDLWEELLEYSMGKPSFIRGLLEEVGGMEMGGPDQETLRAIEVVRRIPEDLEIEGLKQAIQKLVRECGIRVSLSAGVAKVLSGEVGAGMEILRAGRRRGVKFDIARPRSHAHGTEAEVDVQARDVPVMVDGKAIEKDTEKTAEAHPPGHCVVCNEAFDLLHPQPDRPSSKETLIGFACGHVYHLSCLIDSNPETSDSPEADAVLRQLARAYEDEDESGMGTRSVGAKVAHAQMIQGVLRGRGCGVCFAIGMDD